MVEETISDQSLLQTRCISSKTLLAYWEGRLSDDDSTMIEEHLGLCTQCTSILTGIESSPPEDELIAPMRSMEVESLSEGLRRQPPANIMGDRKTVALTQPSLAVPWLPEKRVIGPYRLIEPLGSGGMGSVFTAEHTKLKRVVAIKLLHLPKSWTDARYRFEREVLAIGKLVHPSIVAATDAGQIDDVHYLVMERIHGLDLSRISHATGTLRVADVCEIGRQIALALSYAHSQGLVHRDIKPSNVMLDRSGNVKLLDFGLVLLDRWDGVASELTTIGQFLGTLDYMAPEQAEKSGAVDYRADLYGLGATLFRLLCGRAPLAATPNLSPLEKLRLLANHRPPSLRTLRPDAPEDLIQTVDQLLATDPSQRPASAAHVAESLKPLCDAQDLVALLQTAEQSTSEEERVSRTSVSISRLRDAWISQEPTQALEPSPARRGWNPIVWIGLLLASLGLAFLAGFILKLDTKEGLLVIESEIDDARLTIKKEDGKIEQSLKIETGNQQTRLSAGNYVLEISSPSDAVSLDKETFTITKNQTVIARVRMQKEEASKSLTPPVANAPIYEGKTLAQWLDLVRFERADKAWEAAAVAVLKLVENPMDDALFDEFYTLCKGRWNIRVFTEWKDPRVVKRMTDELRMETDPTRRAALFDQMSRVLSIKKLFPAIEWLDKTEFTNPDEPKELFLRLHQIKTGTKTTGEKYLFVQIPSTDELYNTLASSFPHLNSRYEYLLMEAPRIGASYPVRIAKKILLRDSDSFATQVGAVDKAVNRSQNDSNFAMENALFATATDRLISRIPSELTAKFTYFREQSDGGNLLLGFPKSLENYAAVHLLNLLSGGYSSPETANLYLRVEHETRDSARVAWNRLCQMEPSSPWDAIIPLISAHDRRDNEKQAIESSVAEQKENALAYVVHQIVIRRLTDDYESKDPDEFANVLDSWTELIGKNDSNANGALDPEELDSSLCMELFQRFGLRANIDEKNSVYLKTCVKAWKQQKASHERTLEWVRYHLKKADSNFDALLSPEEFLKYPAGGSFEQVDRNKDGKLDENELTAFREQGS